MKPHLDHTYRRGITIVFIVVVLVGLIALAALAVDIGYVYAVKGQLQATADAAALAGASALPIDADTVRWRAIDFNAKNPVTGGVQAMLQEADVELGLWDANSRVFTKLAEGTAEAPEAVRVTPRLAEEYGNNLTLFFARALGFQTLNAKTSATAVYAPRDIVLAMDYSISMSFDSSLWAIDRYGYDEVHARMLDIWEDLGSPQLGNMTFDPVRIPTANHDNHDHILDVLGLRDVPYPDWAGGSWDEYFNYVHTHKVSPGDQPKYEVPHEFHKDYGYITFINYLQDVRPGVAHTPVLWQTRQQPMRAIKDGATYLLNLIEQQADDDRAALVGYADESNAGVLEQHLTSDYDEMIDTIEHRQAAHYASQEPDKATPDYARGTNLAGAIEAARMELLGNRRNWSAGMIVLLSDGQQYWPEYDEKTYNEDVAAPALAQAALAAAEGISIITISVGPNADTALMQQIADLTGGVHFVAPGGDSILDYAPQLRDVFEEIAEIRPVVLVD